MSKKGFSSEVMVIILLIVALAIIAVLWIAWSSRGKGILATLSDMFPFN